VIDRLRDIFDQLPKPVFYGITAIIILVVLIVTVAIFISQSPASSLAGQPVEEILYRKCVRCGQVSEDRAEDLAAQGYLDNVEYSTLIGGGKRCPKCNRDTLHMAVKCPHDNTVFIPYVIKGKRLRSANCSKCGWNPSTR